jgi:hypothetical protein
MIKKIVLILPFVYVILNKGNYEIDINQTNKNFQNILYSSHQIIHNKDDIISKSIDISKILINKKSLDTYHHLFAYNVNNVFDYIVK